MLYGSAADKSEVHLLDLESGGAPRPVVTDLQTRDGVHGISEVFITPGWYAPDTPDGTIGAIKRIFTRDGRILTEVLAWLG